MADPGAGKQGTIGPIYDAETPRVDAAHFFPLQGYTDIKPGKSVMVHLSINGGRQAIDMGERFSLAQEIPYRFADFDKDGGTPDAEK